MTDTFLLTAGLVIGAMIGAPLGMCMSATAIVRLRAERDEARAVSSYWHSAFHSLKAKALVRGSDGRIRKA